MNAADMGWWKADLTTLNYECSEYISKLLGLDDSGIISFENFNKRILKEEQRPTTVHSFSEQQMSEVVYLLDTVKGAVWVRSKVCFQETDKEGHTNVYGIAELQEASNMTSAYQALQHSERILHNIYKHLPVGIELYNEDGILIDLNDKEQEMFHLEKKEDLLGLDIFKNPMFPEEMKERLRRNEDADFTFRYDFSKIGSYYKNSKREGTIDLVTKVTTLYDDEGNPINYLLINADKTETTIAYNKIQEFEEFFELVGDYAKVGYAHLNLLTGEGYAQKSWYRNIGEADGTPLSDIIGIYRHLHPDDRNCMVQFFEDVRNGLTAKLSKEVRVLRSNGEYTWTHVNLLVRKYIPQDKIIELISINYDITELKKTEEMLVKARDKAEASDRLKSAFLANMSHEIRTPLNAIVGFASLLSIIDDEKEQQEYIGLIQSNTEHLLRLMNDVIDLSNIESGVMDIVGSDVVLDSLMKEMELTYVPKAETNNLVLAWDREQSNAHIYTDRDRLIQILEHLLDNAIKFTTKGTVRWGYQEKENGQIRFYVTDTGCGIPNDKKEVIFERFVKLDSFTQGLGLGLSLCKIIIERMHGTIGVESEVGEGSTFWFTIPNLSDNHI